MGFFTGATGAYLNDWSKKIRDEEKYLRSKDRIEHMNVDGSRPYKSDLERVRDYEREINSPPDWIRKDYWIGGVGAYYFDRAAEYVKERW